MTISKIQIISNAFVLLGGSTIANLDEESTEAKIASSLYDTTYTSLLTQHRWRFSIKKKMLARLSAAPIEGYSNAFQLPTDLLYLVKINSSSPYQVFEDKLYTDATEIIADYQFKVEEHTLPSYFIKALEHLLASQFSIPLTGDLNKASYYNSTGSKALTAAKFADSTQTPGEAFAAQSYADVRY